MPARSHDSAPVEPALSTLEALPRVTLGGLPIVALDLDDTADLMIRLARQPRRGRPWILTSANGEVLSRCARDSAVSRLFQHADAISADGAPLVVAARHLTRTALPERVATTDLFPLVAERAQRSGVSFYLYGATEDENARAADTIRNAYPSLRLVGQSHGFLEGAALERRLTEINDLAPDILWLALGVPREQQFCADHAGRLSGVGVIKTSGGLFNFLSGTRRRAPRWMQRLMLEWLFRTLQEPGRLGWRYLTTNPHALYLLLTRSRQGQT